MRYILLCRRFPGHGWWVLYMIFRSLENTNYKQNVNTNHITCNKSKNIVQNRKAIV